MKINECIDLILEDINNFLYYRSKLQSEHALILFVPNPAEQVYFNAREIEAIRIFKETLESLRIEAPFIDQFVKSSVPGLLFMPLNKASQEEIAIRRQIDALCAVIVLNLGNPTLSNAFKDALMNAKTVMLLKYGNYEKLRNGLL